MAVGDEPVIVFVSVQGAISYIDDRGEVRSTNTTREIAAAYGRFVTEQRAA
jgi:hypothetical protein